VENLTHSLVGAAMAELALPASFTSAQRRIFFTVGVIAANLPDADLVYTRITSPPLGYLLHHRGHTHTLVGAAAQALLIVAVCLTPAIRRHLGGARNRLWALIAVSLLGHIILDSWNSYGVHPFYPFDERWYYGDAIYIVEPWFWAFLGVAATANARSNRNRVALGVLCGALAAAFVRFGGTSVATVAVPALAASVLAWLARNWSPRKRSAAALATVVAYVAMMFGLRQLVREQVVASMKPMLRGELVDVVLSPQPAKPFCWSAITIEKIEHSGEYVMSRATASLAPRALSTTACGLRGQASVEWTASLRQSLATLRVLDRDDCRVSAWLQFGRAPALSDDMIGDYRFGGVARGNFTAMPLAQTSCPEHLTHWGKPRADLLTP
jgi:inner membrane protein